MILNRTSAVEFKMCFILSAAIILVYGTVQGGGGGNTRGTTGGNTGENASGGGSVVNPKPTVALAPAPFDYHEVLHCSMKFSAPFPSITKSLEKKRNSS